MSPKIWTAGCKRATTRVQEGDHKGSRGRPQGFAPTVARRREKWDEEITAAVSPDSEVIEME